MTQKADTHTTSEVDSLRAEIVRLKKIIDDYVYIAAASAREIKQLRQSYEKSDEKRCDSGTGGVTLTAAEREAVEKAADLIDNKTCGDSSTLRSLLERLK